MTDAYKQLEEIDRLEGNWDSCGSPPLTEAAFKAAKAILDSLYDNSPSPSVVPVHGGGCQLEWQKYGETDRDLEIEIKPDGKVIYLKSEEGDIQPENCKQTQDLIKWLVNGCQAPK